MHKINFSGHPVAGFDLAPLVGANLPLVEGQDLSAALREILLALPGREDLLRGCAAEIVLPGMSPAVAALLAEWVGQFGFLPRIRWAVRGTGGSFEWPDSATLNLAEVRESARTSR